MFTEAQFDVPLDIGCDGADALRFVAGGAAGEAAGRLAARVVRAGGGYRLIDLGDGAGRAGAGDAGGAGLLCNGVRVTRSVDLAHGDVLRFGAGGPAVALRLDPPPAQWARPAAPVLRKGRREGLARALARSLSQGLALGLAMGLALVAGQVTGAVFPEVEPVSQVGAGIGAAFGAELAGRYAQVLPDQMPPDQALSGVTRVSQRRPHAAPR
ncbi:hypothetical protein CATMQ487_02340 [Sphaerotilus microaerophilus]|uniref:FHA domain-containing protein n=1 Tax=Sphaerotilus microaerophilus TaxID=2914710 RepID=A0ABM7YGG1_9BURK|nr:hypothetical protein CATMQ487_02340 [Sphaerotilus sp. FB-5]